MKTKPNTDQFKITKGMEEFLEGGAASRAENPGRQTTPALEGRVHREQKIFRLPIDLIHALKRESYERGMKIGSRVTETELVEQALHAFLDI